MFIDKEINDLVGEKFKNIKDLSDKLDSIGLDIKQAERLLGTMPLSAHVSVPIDNEYELTFCIEEKRILMVHTSGGVRPLIEMKVGLRLKGFFVMKNLIKECFDQLDTMTGKL